jgi:predicted dehydrogenase
MKLYHEVCGKQVETVIPIIETKGNLFDMKIRAFLDAVKEDGQSPVPSSQIIYNQAIIDGINKSADLGREIEITVPEV